MVASKHKYDGFRKLDRELVPGGLKKERILEQTFQEMA